MFGNQDNPLHPFAATNHSLSVSCATQLLPRESDRIAIEDKYKRLVEMEDNIEQTRIILKPDLEQQIGEPAEFRCEALMSQINDDIIHALVRDNRRYDYKRHQRFLIHLASTFQATYSLSQADSPDKKLLKTMTKKKTTPTVYFTEHFKQ